MFVIRVYKWMFCSVTRVNGVKYYIAGTWMDSLVAFKLYFFNAYRKLNNRDVGMIEFYWNIVFIRFLYIANTGTLKSITRKVSVMQHKLVKFLTSVLQILTNLKKYITKFK